MTPEQAKDLLPLIAAMAEGKTIQCKIFQWEDIPNPAFLNSIDRYRIKPESKIRPWTADEVPVGQVVRQKHDGGRFLITGAFNKGVQVGEMWTALARMSEFYTMDDGSACGIEVSE